MRELILLGLLYGGAVLFCHGVGALWYTGVGFAMVVHAALGSRNKVT